MKSIRSYLVDNMSQTISIIATVIIGFVLIKAITIILDKSKFMKKLDPTIVTFMNGFIRFIMYVVYLIVLLTMIGIPMTTFIAMLSAIGLAIALALQGNLSNFASAIIILGFKPFKVGDFIESQNNIGTVKEIQMLFTHILTPDNRKIIIPNSELTNSRMINYTAEKIRRIDLVIGASYKDDIEYVKEIITKVVKGHEKVLETPEPVIRLGSHGSSSLDYDVKIWIEKDDYWTVKYDLYEKISYAFIKNNITIPFPQRTVWVNHSEE